MSAKQEQPKPSQPAANSQKKPGFWSRLRDAFGNVIGQAKFGQ